jgi:predicted O-linked N-acetylglucosamine transferase (SPINDLY family)
VLPESFFSHATDMRQRTCWSRKLVRRLWDRGGDLFHRIRLLPATREDAKLLQLLRPADLVLDSFPIGGSFQTIALALSVGTPGTTH